LSVSKIKGQAPNSGESHTDHVGGSGVGVAMHGHGLGQGHRRREL